HAVLAVYPLCLHDALPIFKLASVLQIVKFVPCGSLRRISRSDTSRSPRERARDAPSGEILPRRGRTGSRTFGSKTCEVTQSLARSEEHTSELQSRENLVCR